MIAFNNDYYHLNSFDKLQINTYNLSGLLNYTIENFYLLIGGKLNQSSKNYKGKSKNFGGLYPIVNLKYKLNNLSFNVKCSNLMRCIRSNNILSIDDTSLYEKINNTLLKSKPTPVKYLSSNQYEIG